MERPRSGGREVQRQSGATDRVNAPRGAHILHLDMDSFFAAVEVLHDPALRDRPVIVGGTGNRGVVASASYEARAFGVHAAMPTAEARRLCPHGVFVAPRHDVYGATSSRLLEILRRVTPLVEPIALDEAFLDVVGAHRLFGTSEAIAAMLREHVASELSLSCSVGIARTKFLAKLASKAAKPKIAEGRLVGGSGVFLVRPQEELPFLHAHPVRALPGVGPRTADRLRSLGISSVADLAEVGRENLVSHFGRLQGGVLADLAQGVDSRAVEPDRLTKSIGQEETFAADLYDLATLASYAREFAASVASRARSSGWEGKTVTLKIRYADFSIVTRSRTFDRACAVADELARVAVRLLDEVQIDCGVRLLGVHLSNLQRPGVDAAAQLSLFGEPGAPDATIEESKRDARAGLDAAADEIRDRFGSTAIGTLAAKVRRRSPTEDQHRSTAQSSLDKSR